MIRRALAGLFAAALLVLAPTAAFGYSLDEFDASASTTNPAPGETFTVTITAPSGTPVTLTVTSDDDDVDDDDIQIAGTKSLTKTAVDGAAVFSVTLTEEADYTLVATDNEGRTIETISVRVGAGSGDGAPAPAPGDGAAGPTLPETGATATPIVIGAAVLLLVGGAALFFARRGKVSA